MASVRRDDDFAEFAAARYRTLVRAAVLLGCSHEAAEDAVQDTLVRCFVSWSRVQAADDREAYVYRMLVNGLRRAARRHWNRETPRAEVPESGSTADPAGEVALRESVVAALGRLAHERRDVVVLRYYADLSERQVAQALGIPAGTVKSRAARALAELAADRSLDGLATDGSTLHRQED